MFPSIKSGMKNVLLAGALALTGVSMAQAQQARAAVQAPGYYKMRLGDLVIVALYDGYIGIAPSLMHDISAEDANALLNRMFVPRDERGVQTAVNAYVVEIGERRVLVDSGAAMVLARGWETSWTTFAPRVTPPRTSIRSC
ncbi:MAG: hypothetical protein LBL59_03645 [Xanthomonadaceae bacterium]|jgi:hypothetical protein|nr:hypothetical protein [Xanthomonadaceae bacterium]